MSEPKRGSHYESCELTKPDCKCNTCQKDNSSKIEEACCTQTHGCGCCAIHDCKFYIKDEPTKKGADHE